MSKFWVCQCVQDNTVLIERIVFSTKSELIFGSSRKEAPAPRWPISRSTRSSFHAGAVLLNWSGHTFDGLIIVTSASNWPNLSELSIRGAENFLSGLQNTSCSNLWLNYYGSVSYKIHQNIMLHYATPSHGKQPSICRPEIQYLKWCTKYDQKVTK